MFTIELGEKVKSRINGFAGVITSRAEHLNGCNRYWVEPHKTDKDGKLLDGHWFDEKDLEVIGRKKAKQPKEDPGGFPSRIK